MDLTRREFGSVVGAALGALPLIGCSGAQSGLTIALQALVAAAGAAVTDLGALGTISAGDETTALNWISNVSTFIDDVEAEAASTDTVATKALKIAQDAVTLGIKNLPPGLPQTIASVLNVTLAAVESVLSSVSQTSAELEAHGVNSFQSQQKVVKWTGKLSRKDRAALADVKSKNADLKTKIAKARPKAGLSHDWMLIRTATGVYPYPRSYFVR